jgi:hypothetical protein
LPIVTLAVVLIADKFKTVAARAELTSIISQLRQDGVPIDGAAIAKAYDARTSREDTRAWASMLESASSFQDDPRHGLDGTRDFQMVSPTAESPAAESLAVEGKLNLEVLDFVVNRDRPLTAAREELLAEATGESTVGESKKPVWFPLGAGHGSRWYPSLSNVFRSQDIRAFQASIGHGRNEEAMKVLQRMQRTAERIEANLRFDTVNQRMPLDAHELIRASLAVADWDAGQIKQLRQMVAKRPEYAKMYQRVMDRAIAASITMLGADGNAPMIARVGRNAKYSIEIPPQTVLQWLRYMQKGKAEAQPGTLQQMSKYQWHWEYWPRSSQTEALSLTTFPLATGTMMLSQAGAETGWLISGYARYETSRRWTLTALAIKQYNQQHDRWPASLSDLEAVGLKRSDWHVMSNVPFGYRAAPLADDSEEDEVVLWTPQIRYGNAKEQVIEYSNSAESREPPREHSLSTQYEMSQIALIRNVSQ